MDQKFIDKIKTELAIDAPSNISATVISRIHRKRLIRSRLVFLYSSTGMLASIATCIVVLRHIMDTAYKSGLNSFLSFFLSDYTAVMSYWQEFAVSVAESLPTLALFILFVALASLLWSGAKTIRSAQSLLVTA